MRREEKQKGFNKDTEAGCGAFAILQLKMYLVGFLKNILTLYSSLMLSRSNKDGYSLKLLLTFSAPGAMDWVMRV